MPVAVASVKALVRGSFRFARTEPFFGLNGVSALLPQKFPAVAIKVSHWGHKSFPLGTQKFPHGENKVSHRGNSATCPYFPKRSSAAYFVCRYTRLRYAALLYLFSHSPKAFHASGHVSCRIAGKNYRSFCSCSCRCMDAAALRPSPMARITVAPPRTMSPPA